MRSIVVAAFLGLAAARGAWCQEPVVWVASPWQHVLRDTEPGPAGSAAVAAARNEYEPLRVVVRAGAQRLDDVRVEAGALTRPGGEIAAEQRTLFREHYIHVFQPSPASQAPTGWYPDALIPCAGGDPAVRAAATYPAMPFAVEPGMNQGVWVDVYIPRDTAPGEYTGTIRVTAADAVIGSIPVSLRVLPFTLPDEISLRSNFGGLDYGLARRAAQACFAELTVNAHRPVLGRFLAKARALAEPSAGQDRRTRDVPETNVFLECLQPPRDKPHLAGVRKPLNVRPLSRLNDRKYVDACTDSARQAFNRLYGGNWIAVVQGQAAAVSWLDCSKMIDPEL